MQKICLLFFVLFCVCCLILYYSDPFFKLLNGYEIHVNDLHKLSKINEVQPSLLLKIVPDIGYYFGNKSDESAINIISAFYDPRIKKIIIMYHKY